MKAGLVIKTRLSGFAGVTALVGAAPNDRIYPVVLPEKCPMPAIFYRQIDSTRLQGPHSDPGVANVRMQVVSLATSYDAAKALAEQVRIALERYGTAITGTAIAGVTVYDITIGSDADSYEPELDLFAVSTDFTVTHQE